MILLWSPHTCSDTHSIEKIWHKFLRQLAVLYNDFISHDQHEFSILKSEYKITSLEFRRYETDLTLLYNILNGYTNSIEFRKLISFNVPVVKTLRYGPNNFSCT